MGRLPVSSYIVLAQGVVSDLLPSFSVTMGIRNMPFEDWIELDREFPQFHKVCDYRIRTRGDRLVSVQPEQPGVVASGHAAGA